MYTLKTHYPLDVTPEQADAWLQNNNEYIGQRNFRPKHCNELAAKMADGRFMRGFIVFGVLPGGKRALANGQHQCAAIIRSGRTVNANVEEYHCSSPGDIYALYTQLDQGLTRTATDVLRASRGDMRSALRIIPPSFLGQCGAAILMSARSPEPLFLSREVSAHDRAASAKQNPDLVRFLDRFARMTAARRLPVLMAMAATWRLDAERARLFWDVVAEGLSGLPATDPRARMRAVLLLPKKKGSTTAAGVRELYSVCIHHWNAHAAGTEVREYDPDQVTPTPVEPTAPMPTLATVRLAPRSTSPQTFTGSRPGLAAKPAVAMASAAR